MIGATVFNVGNDSFVYPDAFERLATTAEDAGFDSLWFQDHVVIPEEIPDEYPFRPDGTAPIHSGLEAYDLFDVLSYVAAITDRITIGSNACIPGYRHPVVLAKNAVTVDALANERFALGLGAGWLETEFEVLDSEFSQRGVSVDEFLDLLHKIYADPDLVFDGPIHQFQRSGFRPVPRDGTTPPILVGGKSGATFRRAAEYGDGWTINWDRPEDIRETRPRLVNAWSDYDRDGEPRIMVSRPGYVGTDGPYKPDKPLTGTPDEIIDDMQAYADAGATSVTFMPYETDVDAQMELLESLGESVLPSF